MDMRRVIPTILFSGNDYSGNDYSGNDYSGCVGLSTCSNGECTSQALHL